MTPAQCRAARGLIRLEQLDLCEKSGVSIKTLSDFEAGKTKPYATTLEKLRAALEAAGVVFIESNGQGPGVRLRGSGK